jgi:hypothetical protein
MNSNNKNKSLEILFNPKQCSYNVMCSFSSTTPDSFYLTSENIEKDALVNIIKKFERIKFVGLNSLINFCKLEKYNSLQLVLEWVNMFIYRDERKQFEAFRGQSNLVIGITNVLDEFKKEVEECNSLNGFKYFTSDLRINLGKLITQLIASSDILIASNDYVSLCNKLIFNIFSLNFEEALKIIKEAASSKEIKIPNEDMPFLILFQEVINQFLNTSTNSNIFSILEKMQSSSNLQFVNLFIQQKLSSKLIDFLYNKEISLLLKLVYILKNNNYSDLINNLELLQNYYAENGILEGLILTGNSYKSIVLLQSYLDKTDNILVPVILSKFFVDQNESFYTQVEDTLNETLNRMKMFNERIFLNQKLNEIVSHLEKGFRIHGDKKSSTILNNHNSTEMILSCFYCNAKIHAERADQFKNLFVNNKEENVITFINLD